MKPTLLLSVALIASACSAQVPSTSDKLMDEIEQQVRLPEGASPLQHYARHYAFEKGGKVIGIYVLRAPASAQDAARQAPDYGCEELALNGDEIIGKPVPCTAEPGLQNGVAAGDRRWFSDFAELPMIMDGGCGIVTVRFNYRTNRVEQAFCNGEA